MVRATKSRSPLAESTGVGMNRPWTKLPKLDTPDPFDVFSRHQNDDDATPRHENVCHAGASGLCS